MGFEIATIAAPNKRWLVNGARKIKLPGRICVAETVVRDSMNHMKQTGSDSAGVYNYIAPCKWSEYMRQF